MALTTHLVIAQSHSRLTLHLLVLMTVFVLSIILHSKQALAAAATDDCIFQKYSGTDNSELVAAKQRISALVGHSYTSFDGNSYKFTVGICTKLGNQATENAGVLQEKLKDDGTVDTDKPFIIGSLQDTHIMVGTDWVMLEYRGGDSYSSHCNGEAKQATIMITCDEYTDDSNAKMVFMKEENTKDDSCYYLFEMKHKAVCPVSSGGGGLSVGSILVIVFFSVLAVYLLVGFIYQRFVQGSKGIEQIPNYEFWKDFGNLQADGCDFICRSKGRQRAGHILGLGDDQLDPAEEIRDDNLLPM